MQRLTRDLVEANAEITAAKTTNQDVEATLVAALAAATNCQAAYAQAPGHIRKQINQGFFEKLFIGEDGSVERVAFTEPFRALTGTGQVVASIRTDATMDVTATQMDEDEIDKKDTSPERTRPEALFRAMYDGEMAITPSDRLNTNGDRVQMVAGVNVLCMVELRGFEPLTPTLPVRFGQ
jgi:hypothetical protein